METQSISKILPELYLHYGQYVNSNKMLPNAIDGLIPVWRRVLLGTHTMARNKFVKSASILGVVMEKWHPHDHAYGPLQKLVQNGFVDGQGQWGGRIGVDESGAAAMRYTEAKSNALTEEMAFKYIKHTPWETLEVEPEPVFLPTMIPFCLFTRYGFTSIAFGFKSVIPNYKLKSLVQRLLYLEGELKRKPSIVPNIEGCDIVSNKKEIEKVLTISNHNIDIRGIYKEDPDNFKIYVRGWDPNLGFETIFKKIDKAGIISNGDVIMLDESSDETPAYDGWKGTNISFEVNKARNRPKFYAMLKKQIVAALTSRISYMIHVVDPLTKQIQTPCVDDMLKKTFIVYKNIVKRFLQESIEDTKTSIRELIVISKIKDHLGKALALNDEKKIIDEVHKKSGVDKESIQNVVDKYKIRKLLTVKTDNKNLKVKLEEYKANLKNLNVFVINQYKELYKKL